MKDRKVAWLIIKELTRELQFTRRGLQNSQKEHAETISRDTDRCRKLSEELERERESLRLAQEALKAGVESDENERLARLELQKERDELLAEVKLLRLDMKNRSAENDALVENNGILNRELSDLQTRFASLKSNRDSLLQGIEKERVSWKSREAELVNERAKLTVPDESEYGNIRVKLPTPAGQQQEWTTVKALVHGEVLANARESASNLSKQVYRLMYPSEDSDFASIRFRFPPGNIVRISLKQAIDELVELRKTVEPLRAEIRKLATWIEELEREKKHQEELVTLFRNQRDERYRFASEKAAEIVELKKRNEKDAEEIEELRADLDKKTRMLNSICSSIEKSIELAPGTDSTHISFEQVENDPVTHSTTVVYVQQA